MQNGSLVADKGFVVMHKDHGLCWGVVKKDCQTTVMGWTNAEGVSPLPKKLLSIPTDLAGGSEEHYKELEENGKVVEATKMIAVAEDTFTMPKIVPFPWDTSIAGLDLKLDNELTHSMDGGNHRLHDKHGNVIIELTEEKLTLLGDGLETILTMMIKARHREGTESTSEK